MLKNKLLSAMGGAPANYIEDVFSTWLYTGNGSTQPINNGIDLAGKGGLTWIKSRSNATENLLYDTARGAYNYLISSTTGAQSNGSPTGLSAFNADGFSVAGTTIGGGVNGSGATYASWTFRKQPKFFDVVTWSGDGTNNRQIPHAIAGSVGCIFAKRTDTSTNWAVYHRSIASGAYLQLNTTSAEITGSPGFFGDGSVGVAPTSSVFTVSASLNASGGTYVAYLFAHNAGGFGLSGEENVISCGSYTGNGSANGPEINLGYEPQYVLIKNANDTGYWFTFDNMRGIATSGTDALLWPNVSDAEANSTDNIDLTATGFKIKNSAGSINGSGNTLIYIAIRRGPMKTPTSGTSVFALGTSTSDSSGYTLTSNFPVDSYLYGRRTGGSNHGWMERLTNGRLFTNTTDAEGSTSGYVFWDSNVNVRRTGLLGGASTVDYAFRRAPSFFDEVCYTGTGVAGRTVAHNLTVVPELMIVKFRAGGTSGANWTVYTSATGATKYLPLNLTNGAITNVFSWNDTSPTSTVFTVGSGGQVNASGDTYVAYLFASCPGVSKVGSYTGTGTTQQINCGFTAGSRFVLIKRTDDVGDWYVWDSARGIVAGNDPYLLLNSTAAEVTSTDYIDTYSAGFEISSTAPADINASGGTFIFLAIA